MYTTLNHLNHYFCVHSIACLMGPIYSHVLLISWFKFFLKFTLMNHLYFIIKYLFCCGGALLKPKRSIKKKKIGNFNGTYILASNLVIVFQKIEGQVIFQETPAFFKQQLISWMNAFGCLHVLVFNFITAVFLIPYCFFIWFRKLEEMQWNWNNLSFVFSNFRKDCVVSE